jgi:hypothetical protein
MSFFMRNLSVAAWLCCSGSAMAETGPVNAPYCAGAGISFSDALPTKPADSVGLVEWTQGREDSQQCRLVTDACLAAAGCSIHVPPPAEGGDASGARRRIFRCISYKLPACYSREPACGRVKHQCVGMAG